MFSSSRQLVVDLGDDSLERLVLLAVERDSLLARLGVQRLLVLVPLADVDVSAALELANLKQRRKEEVGRLKS